MTNRATASNRIPAADLRMQAGNLLISCLFGETALKDALETFARNLAFWLKKRDMSGAELARRLTDRGYPSTRGAVSHWLAAKQAPNLQTSGVVAEILEIPLWYLHHEAGSRMPDGFAAPPNEKEDAAELVLRSMADLLGKEIRTIRPKRPPG